MQAAHTAVLSDMGEQQDLNEDPALALDNEGQEETPGSSQQDKYVDLERYNNEYYTQDSRSDGEGLFTFTDFNDIED